MQKWNTNFKAITCREQSETLSTWNSKHFLRSIVYSQFSVERELHFVLYRQSLWTWYQFRYCYKICPCFALLKMLSKQSTIFKYIFSKFILNFNIYILNNFFSKIYPKYCYFNREKPFEMDQWSIKYYYHYY